jgi:putative membrane protein
MHIVGVIVWAGGLIFLPRLYALHAGVAPGSPADAQMVAIERRLFRTFMNPAEALVWVLGVLMIAGLGGWDYFSGTVWLQVKVSAVALMTALQHLYGRWQRAYERGERPLKTPVLRALNEAPVVLIAVAVAMAAAKPSL